MPGLHLTDRVPDGRRVGGVPDEGLASVPASPSSVTPASRRSGLRPTRATFQPSRPKRCAMDRELPGPNPTTRRRDMTLRSWVVVGPVGGRPARNVWYSPHYAHVRRVTGADQPQHRSSASPGNAKPRTVQFLGTVLRCRVPSFHLYNGRRLKHSQIVSRVRTSTGATGTTVSPAVTAVPSGTSAPSPAHRPSSRSHRRRRPPPASRPPRRRSAAPCPATEACTRWHAR